MRLTIDLCLRGEARLKHELIHKSSSWLTKLQARSYPVNKNNSTGQNHWSIKT